MNACMVTVYGYVSAPASALFKQHQAAVFIQQALIYTLYCNYPADKLVDRLVHKGEHFGRRQICFYRN